MLNVAYFMYLIVYYNNKSPDGGTFQTRWEGWNKGNEKLVNYSCSMFSEYNRTSGTIVCKLSEHSECLNPAGSFGVTTFYSGVYLQVNRKQTSAVIMSHNKQQSQKRRLLRL